MAVIIYLPKSGWDSEDNEEQGIQFLIGLFEELFHSLKFNSAIL